MKKLCILIIVTAVLSACGGASQPGGQGIPVTGESSGQLQAGETEEPGLPQAGASFTGPIDISGEGASSGTLTFTISDDGTCIATLGINLKDFKCGGMSAGESTVVGTANAPLGERIEASVSTVGEIDGVFDSATTAHGTIHLTPGVMGGNFKFTPCELGTFDWTAELTKIAPTSLPAEPQPPTEKVAPTSAGLAPPPTARAAATATAYAAPAEPASSQIDLEGYYAFTGPILAAIGPVAPYIADDFSSTGKGWEFGGLPVHQAQEGSAIVDGVIRLVAEGISGEFSNPNMERRDWVLMYDVRAMEGDIDTALGLHFRQVAAERHFQLELTPNKHHWIVRKQWDGPEPVVFSKGDNEDIAPGNWMQVMIVARGPRAAVSLNGEPIGYFEDADFDQRCGIEFFCHTITRAVCEVDNLFFWDLAQVPGLP